MGTGFDQTCKNTFSLVDGSNVFVFDIKQHNGIDKLFFPYRWEVLTSPAVWCHTSSCEQQGERKYQFVVSEDYFNTLNICRNCMSSCLWCWSIKLNKVMHRRYPLYCFVISSHGQTSFFQQFPVHNKKQKTLALNKTPAVGFKPNVFYKSTLQCIVKSKNFFFLFTE